MFTPVRTVAPATSPVTLAEAKTQLRVTGSEDDTLIQALIDAGTSYLDGWSGILGRALVTQTWRQDFGYFCDRLSLPLAPAASITSITYYDRDNVQQTLATSVYVLFTDALGPYVALLRDQNWPDVADRDDPISVTFVAGYGAASAVPAPLRQAIILMVQKLYASAKSDLTLQREAVDGIGMREWRGGEQLLAAQDQAVASLVAPYRRVWL